MIAGNQNLYPNIAKLNSIRIELRVPSRQKLGGKETISRALAALESAAMSKWARAPGVEGFALALSSSVLGASPRQGGKQEDSQNLQKANDSANSLLVRQMEAINWKGSKPAVVLETSSAVTRWLGLE